MIFYWIFSVVFYIGMLVAVLYRLRDIRRNPQKYKEVKGLERYKKSFWYEKKYERYGLGYYANLIFFIPFILLFLQGYYFFCGMLHVIFPILAGNARESDLFYIGCCGCIFYQIALVQYLLFKIHRPMFVAARIYSTNFDWVYGGKYDLCLRDVYRWLFWCTLICMPFMLIGLVL